MNNIRFLPKSLLNYQTNPLLESEGIKVQKNNDMWRIGLSKYLWQPRLH